jgi:hypothetical protein
MPLLGNSTLPPSIIFSGSPDAILPFLKEETVALNRDNLVTVELRINSEDADPPKV